eukprot:TRINITY_DN5113_c0_g1_i1.p1 TRINITY_DN5113_c0_g1~~TRINITY_DN5113_c0_g1_i1.p1  ORF type:complete len:488 (+),score=90.83 TRINITY_DN5113_c0_g1_i1:99-1562(+)
MNSKQYKTLPGSLRPRSSEKGEKKGSEHAHSPLFGLQLSFHNFISSGVNFLDNLRKKTPNSPVVRSPSHSSSSNSSMENIELMPVQVLEVTGSGEGHDWQEEGCTNPTWCDLCGELIWGLYDTGAWVCHNCSYTVHLKCRDKVKLDCSCTQDFVDGSIISTDRSIINDDDDSTEMSTYTTAAPSTYTTAAEVFDDDATETLTTRDDKDLTLNGVTDEFHSVIEETDEYHTLKDIDDLEDEAPVLPLFSLPPEKLTSMLTKYNAFFPGNQETHLDKDENIFKGFIRVEMNLQRPINVISGTRPPSVYNISKEDTYTDRTLTSFYLPPATVKAVCVTSCTTAQDVIRSLLKKFKVADNPHKYALYERYDDKVARRDSITRTKSLSRPKLRRIPEGEKPLVCALMSVDEKDVDSKKFILQENDPGEILWDQFSLPELNNFLRILDREEAWYKRQIHEKYELAHLTIQKILEQKKLEADVTAGDERNERLL